jgi:transposase
VLMGISKMEQCGDAVLAVMRDGFTVTVAAQKFGVSRHLLYRCMARYEEDGLEALAEGSHRQKFVPHQMAGEIEIRVLGLRRQHPLWGPLRLQYQLKRKGMSPAPSHMAIYRALVRHSLFEPGTKRKKLQTYKRWERGRGMEFWRMDVVGGVLFADGSEAKILTGVDDHSRFCVGCGIMMWATSRPVSEFFAAARIVE